MRGPELPPTHGSDGVWEVGEEEEPELAEYHACLGKGMHSSKPHVGQRKPDRGIVWCENAG